MCWETWIQHAKLVQPVLIGHSSSSYGWIPIIGLNRALYIRFVERSEDMCTRISIVSRRLMLCMKCHWAIEQVCGYRDAIIG